MNSHEIAIENRRRLAAAVDNYNPITGEGATGDRVEVSTPVEDLPWALVPRTMVDDPQYEVATDPQSWRRLRCRHDFEYWCVSCVLIKPKNGYRQQALRLNRAQRKVLAVLEADRLAGRPIRIIVLKARQWGCSTLIQNYMAWIQLCHRTEWSSLICCHKKDCAVNIRRLYTDLITRYPAELAESDEALRFKPFEGSTNVREISGRNCRVIVSSSDNQDAVRGYDIAMAHLSETAFWRSSPQHDPDDIIRSVCGSVDLQPYTLVAMESTANGIGNFFHREWQRAVARESDKTPVFVAWFEIDFYSLDIEGDEADFAASLDAYETSLWEAGCTLQQINWYRNKARGYADRSLMQAEYPSNDFEAFSATTYGVFARDDIERMEATCCKPRHTFSIVDGQLTECSCGDLKVWSKPEADAKYIAAVDIGGRSERSDWSVIAVLRIGEGGQPHEVVAQWRGHVDHDVLVDNAVFIAQYYSMATLVVESNSLEGGSDAVGANPFILRRFLQTYNNNYFRNAGSDNRRLGLHANRSSKPAMIDTLIRAIREGEFIERSQQACYEYSLYRLRPDGAYAAEDGHHDDILMTRAIALSAINEEPQAVISGQKLREVNSLCW